MLPTLGPFSRPTLTGGLDQIDERAVVIRLAEDPGAGVAAIEDMVAVVGF